MSRKQRKIRIVFHPKGFTLIEVVLVVSLISMVGLAVYHSIANGLRIWERSQRFVGEEDIAIFFDKLSQDLHNAFPYSLISFEGKEDSMSFPTIVRTPADKKRSSRRQDYVDQIGQVKYYFDFMHHSLFRQQANYSQALNRKFGRKQLLATPVQSVRFSYYYDVEDELDIKGPEEGELPSAVQVEVELFDTTGQKTTMMRLIPIPLGTKGIEI